MSRRHRHHRRIATKQPEFLNPAIINDPVIETVNSPIAFIQSDLLKTARVISILVVILGIMTFLNHRLDWTLILGNRLYQLLHIR